MMAKHKRRGGRAWKVAVVCLGAFVLLGGGTAYAAFRYDRSAADRILPGIEIAGIEVGGLTRDEAVRRVQARADLRLSDRLTVRSGDRAWVVTPAELGMTADVEGAVDRAFAVADGLSFVTRVYHRLSEKPLDRQIDVAFESDPSAVAAFVQRAAQEIAVPAVDARIALVDDELVARRSRVGRELKSGAAARAVLQALVRRSDAVDLPVRQIMPDVTSASLGKTIVVDLSEETLRLYDGLKVVKRYPVATGQPQYPTPTGSFEIVNKVENPTWYNPAQDTWGAGMPASIGPGPGNPLGTRAMYLSAPGIRIHGTWDSDSIGTAASHGCIRMYIQDSEQLYPRVPVGTPVLIKP